MLVSKLKRNPGNPRQIKGEKLELLKASVGGFQKMMALRPMIVDENNVVLGGNMRLAAIKALGLKEIPDEWVKRADDLTPDEKAQFIITDNSSFGEYDWDEIANSWTDYPLDDWGLDVPDFEAVEEPGTADAEPQMDKAAELNKKWKVKSGDLWLIGSHRLLCGDSTASGDVERLLGGERCQACFTDPPYGIGEVYDVYSDTPDELAGLIAGWLPLAQSAAEVVMFTPGNKHQWLYPPPTWVLGWFTGGGSGVNPWGFTSWHAVYAYGGDPYLKRGLGSRPDALSLTESADNETGHPCSKPIKVWQWFLERGSINKGDNIYEPFAGSGTTLVACQNLNRKCYAIEISESYCAVILQRMADAFPDLEIKRVEDAKSANN